MEDKQSRIDLANKHLDRANQSAKAASKLLEESLHADSVSRSYYAVFHAITAMLISIGLETKSHRGLLHQFYKHFVENDRVSIEISKRVSRLLSMRSDADYGYLPIIEEAEAREGIALSAEVIEIAKEWVKTLK